MKFRLIYVCKGEAVSAIPQDVIRYDLKASIPNLERDGYQVDDKDMMLIARKEGIEVTIYMNGRLMISPMKDKEWARKISEATYESLVVESE
ncbi:MAG: hypothetical protein A4E32_00924 [Methanomassiliicoccales archaeon PtaU1.Bin124]|nr:MAG: hypothetical protein A4E32_00924 [Methanomassiliicoccales archaeon PtaU1.Bin124]